MCRPGKLERNRDSIAALRLGRVFRRGVAPPRYPVTGAKATTLIPTAVRLPGFR